MPCRIFNKGCYVDGLELKIARVRAGLTLWKLGQLAGVHAARISEMERGQRIIGKAVVTALEEVPGVEGQIAGTGEIERVST